MNLPNTINQLAKSDEKFKIVSDFTPSGDQPAAIKTLVKNLNDNENEQVLLGVTGSGKTFTMAKVIEQIQKPTLIMAPNKTLAAQLYGEMKSLFPNNAVEYFVSYMIIIPQKPMFQKVIHLLKKNHQLTNKLTDFVTRLPDHL